MTLGEVDRERRAVGEGEEEGVRDTEEQGVTETVLRGEELVEGERLPLTDPLMDPEAERVKSSRVRETLEDGVILAKDDVGEAEGQTELVLEGIFTVTLGLGDEEGLAERDGEGDWVYEVNGVNETEGQAEGEEDTLAEKLALPVAQLDLLALPTEGELEGHVETEGLPDGEGE